MPAWTVIVPPTRSNASTASSLNNDSATSAVIGVAAPAEAGQATLNHHILTGACQSSDGIGHLLRRPWEEHHRRTLAFDVAPVAGMCLREIRIDDDVGLGEVR